MCAQDVYAPYSGSYGIVPMASGSLMANVGGQTPVGLAAYQSTNIANWQVHSNHYCCRCCPCLRQLCSACMHKIAWQLVTGKQQVWGPRRLRGLQPTSRPTSPTDRSTATTTAAGADPALLLMYLVMAAP